LTRFSGSAINCSTCAASSSTVSRVKSPAATLALLATVHNALAGVEAEIAAQN
jgi:hypothetical protein